MNAPEPLQQLDGNFVRWRGRKLIYFSGCDYFRLSRHPAVLKAVADGLKKFGLNVAASRLTTGNHKFYESLERQLAAYFGAQDALLVPNGYLTNLVVTQALAGSFSHALVDERAHPALLDAASQLNCPILKFLHRDVGDFARAIKVGQASCLPATAKPSQELARAAALAGPAGSLSYSPIVLTDGMFSHDGSVAPLKAYLKVLPREGLILVDDAHGAGVLGRNGQGAPEFENVSRRQIIQCVTLSKALGVYGGAILGTRKLRQRIFERSRSFIGSTPLPLPLANAALQSANILSLKGNVFRRRLDRNVHYVRAALNENIQHSTAISKTPGPIIPIYTKTEMETRALKKRLLAAGIYPPFLKYPGGDENGYFRFVISSEHSRAQLDKLIAALAGFKRA